MLRVCTFSGLTVYYWTTNWFVFPCERISLLPAFLICSQSLSRIRTTWVFHYPIWHVHWCHSCSDHIWVVILVRLYGTTSDIMRPLNLKLLILWLLEIFVTSFLQYSQALHLEVYSRYFYRDWTSNSAF